MYENRYRREQTPEQVDRHAGTRDEFLRRHEHACSDAHGRGPAAVREMAPHLLHRIADTRNLRVAWEHLRAHGGDSAGPNGQSYRNYTERDSWRLVRELATGVLAGTYTPGPDRIVSIPKDSGESTRSLRISDIQDRLVQRATLQILQPLLDPGYSPLSFGVRPGRGMLDALAHAEVLITKTSRARVIVDDIREAFDQVPLGRLLDVLRARLHDERLIAFLERQITSDGNKGLRQGSPLSPLLLNLYLDHFLDRPWRRKHSEIPLIRYVDDVLVLCRPGDDVERHYDELSQMLTAAGLPLKGCRQDSIHDLNAGATVRWLGFEICQRTLGLEFRLPCDGDNPVWLRRLRESLLLAHDKSHSPQRALQVVRGFLESAGPCYPFEDRRAVYDRQACVMRELAYEEMESRKVCIRRWKDAYRRWCNRRMAVASALGIQREYEAAAMTEDA